MQVGSRDVFEGTIPESTIGDYENARNLSEVVAKPVGIPPSTSGTRVSNVTAGPHVGISPLYCMQLLSHITDFNLYNRFIIFKLSIQILQ